MVPDYYAMLGVEPGADRATIEAALAKSQPAWSSGTRNPKTKHTYQSYLDQIPALRQTLLGEPTARAAYDAELAALRRGERDAKLDLLQKRVRLRSAKGGLTVSDRKALRDEAARLGLTVDDLDQLVATIPPKPEAPGGDDDTSDPPLDLVDPVMRRQLRVALDHLRKRDLYDALGIARDAPDWDVATRADAERQRWMKKSQVTAEKTAWLEVVTLAQAHLTNPVARSRYDRTLVAESEETLNEAIAFTLKGLTRLDQGSRGVLLDEAATLGITPERAERLIARGCRAIGVVRDATPAAAFENVVGPPRLLRCRSCGGVTDFRQVSRPNASHDCRHCGASMQWTCPVDKRVHWVDEPRCACGFRVEMGEPLARHFDAAQEAFRQREYAAAAAHLKRVLEIAPRHPGARKGIERVKERVAEVDRARADYEVARAGAHLVAAKEAALAWGRLVPQSAPDWRSAFTEVTRGLRDAQALIARARSLELADPAKSRELYRRAMALAADLPEAHEGLEATPPSPPSDLTAESIDGRVRLRWAPPPPDGLGPVSYVILRKAEALPRHPADGLRVGTSSSPNFEDAGVTPGTSVAYAVLSLRGEVESAGAVAVGPIYLIGEVQGVRVETRSREVDLWWTPPAGASSIRVVRKRGGPPTGPLDGDRVEAGPDQAHDRGLEPDRVYHYGIYSVFRTADGRSVASNGVTITAQPHTPIHPLDAPLIAPEADGRIMLRWVEPPRGLVKIVRTGRPFPHPPGSRLAPVDVANLEGDWIDVNAPDHALDTPPVIGGCYYTPLTSWGGSATVGHPALYSSVTDPTDLRAGRPANGQISLRWRWSPHGAQSLVVIRSGSPPTGPDDPLARVETVHEADYGRLGRFLLTLPSGESGPWHLAVYALATVDGSSIVSPGQEPSARTVVSGANLEVTLSYTFRRPKLRRRAWSVTFRTEPAGASIPPTVVVTHERTVPLSADDGSVVASFPASTDGATLTLPNDVDLKRTRGRIFADPRTDPNALPPIRLVHPQSDTTRV